MTSPTEELKSLGASIGRFKAMLHWKKQELAYFPKHYSGADADDLKCYISDIENILGRIAELEGEKERLRKAYESALADWKADIQIAKSLKEKLAIAVEALEYYMNTTEVNVWFTNYKDKAREALERIK